MSKSVPRSGAPGVIVKTGMRAERAVAIADPSVDSIVLSPPTHSACAPRATSDCTASVTAALLSTFASSSVRPSSRQASRAFSVNASELDSAGFQATPTRVSEGSARLATSKLSFTGRNEPWPTMCRGCFSGLARSSPTPALNGSATRVKTWTTRPSRFALATACIDGVLVVSTMSNSPVVTWRAMALPVARSPWAL